MYECIKKYMYVYMYVLKNVCIYVRILKKCMYVCKKKCMYVFMY